MTAGERGRGRGHVEFEETDLAVECDMADGALEEGAVVYVRHAFLGRERRVRGRERAVDGHGGREEGEDVEGREEERVAERPTGAG